MQQAAIKYSTTKNIEQFIDTLEKNKGCHNEEIYWAIAGTHYMTPPQSNYTAAKALLLKSIEVKNNPMALYNLGYLYEQIIKSADFKNNDDNEKNMLLYYQQALDLGEKKAANQIGLYYINKDIIPSSSNFANPNMRLTVEEYLLIAHKANIMQATNNLIIYYRKKNNYEKCLEIMMYKYKKTQNALDLMDLTLYMLNNNKYADYCKFMKSIGKNDMDMSALITHKNMVNDECAVCLETKKCFKLECSHIVCNNCIFKIFTDANASCPLCRKQLTKSLDSI